MSEQLLKEILCELKTLNQRVGNLEEGQKELVQRVGNLEEGQKELVQRVGNLEEGQKELVQRVGNLEEGQKELVQRVGNLEEGQTKLEERLTRLEEHQIKLETRLENEVINKIDALFDGFSLRGDQIEKLQQHLDERLENISHDVNYLISKSARHETAIQELKRAK